MMDEATETKLHNIWICMRRRCYDTNRWNYHNYGGRGIGICDEWRYSFRAFADWAVNDGGFVFGKTIDRIDNDRGYSPDNCRFATPKEQGVNRRTTRFITVGNYRMCLTDWASHMGVTKHSLYVAERRGTPPEDYIVKKLPNIDFWGGNHAPN